MDGFLMTNPYIGKLNPAAGKGLGGLPRKAGDSGGGDSASFSWTPKEVNRHIIPTGSISSTGAHNFELPFEIQDIRRVAIRFLPTAMSASTIYTNDIFLGAFNVEAIFAPNSNFIKPQFTSSTNLRITTQSNDNTTWAVLVVEYDIEVLSSDTININTDKPTGTALPSEIIDVSKTYISIFPRVDVTKNTSWSFPLLGFSSNTMSAWMFLSNANQTSNGSQMYIESSTTYRAVHESNYDVNILQIK